MTSLKSVCACRRLSYCLFFHPTWYCQAITRGGILLNIYYYIYVVLHPLLGDTDPKSFIGVKSMMSAKSK